MSGHPSPIWSRFEGSLGSFRGSFQTSPIRFAPQVFKLSCFGTLKINTAFPPSHLAWLMWLWCEGVACTSPHRNYAPQKKLMRLKAFTAYRPSKFQETIDSALEERDGKRFVLTAKAGTMVSFSGCKQLASDPSKTYRGAIFVWFIIYEYIYIHIYISLYHIIDRYICDWYYNIYIYI